MNVRRKEINLLYIITGSIAAIKAYDIVSKLSKKIHETDSRLILKILLSKNAQKFITSYSIKALAHSENIELEVVTENLKANLDFDSLEELIDFKLEEKLQAKLAKQKKQSEDSNQRNNKLVKNSLNMEANDFSENNKILHIELAQWADITLIAPATANFIAKFANGIADSLIFETLLAYSKEKPILVAPAMNTNMLENEITQANIDKIKSNKNNVTMLATAEGLMACKTTGKGRLAEPKDIIAKLFENIDSMVNSNTIRQEEILNSKSAKNKQKTENHSAKELIKVLISAGGTKEYLDPVRFIGNSSSGKMAFALIKAFKKIEKSDPRYRFEINLVSTLDLPDEILDLVSSHTRVNSALDMLSALEEQIINYNILFMAAAVADYRPVTYSKQKIKKNKISSLKDATELMSEAKINFSSQAQLELHKEELAKQQALKLVEEQNNDRLKLELVKNPDIVKTLSESFNKTKQSTQKPYFCGFALETENLSKNAKEKMKAKGLDMIIANNQAALNSDQNEVKVFTKNSCIELTKQDKIILAKEIVLILLKDYETKLGA